MKFTYFLSKPFSDNSHTLEVSMRRRMLFTIFKYLFLFQRYSSFYNMQVSQVMTLLKLNRILIKYDEKRYLSQFILEMLDSLHEDSSRCASQHARTSFVTMATYWVPDLPDFKGFAGHFWRSILIFAIGPHRHDPASM